MKPARAISLFAVVLTAAPGCSVTSGGRAALGGTGGLLVAGGVVLAATADGPSSCPAGDTGCNVGASIDQSVEALQMTLALGAILAGAGMLAFAAALPSREPPRALDGAGPAAPDEAHACIVWRSHLEGSSGALRAALEANPPPDCLQNR